MTDAATLRDATGTVSVGDAGEVAAAIERILESRFGAGSFDAALLRATSTLVRRMYCGEEPGYVACDMPYHDLRHSLDVALVMARLVEGYRSAQGDASDFTARHALLGVLLALMHDVGLVRKVSEGSMHGPQLLGRHEGRSVAFAEAYLATTSLAEHAHLARLVFATQLATDADGLFDGCDAHAAALGRMIGSADLLSQVADRFYPERCYYHLYPELLIGGCDRVRAADGSEQLLFRDALDLLAKTPAFYDNVVRARLDGDFRGVARYLGAHFGGADPYPGAIAANIARIARIATDGRMDLLGPEPATTTRDLTAAYAQATRAQRG